MYYVMFCNLFWTNIIPLLSECLIPMRCNCFLIIPIEMPVHRFSVSDTIQMSPVLEHYIQTGLLSSDAALCFNPQIHSDSDEGIGSIKYTISGEGAGTVFIIDEVTGDIHATERLDREEKTFYTLRAQALDRQTDAPLEPESEFVIKVQDINDSEPKFLEGPYIGSVAELSPIGKNCSFCNTGVSRL